MNRDLEYLYMSLRANIYLIVFRHHTYEIVPAKWTGNYLDYDLSDDCTTMVPEIVECINGEYSTKCIYDLTTEGMKTRYWFKNKSAAEVKVTELNNLLTEHI